MCVRVISQPMLAIVSVVVLRNVSKKFFHTSVKIFPSFPLLKEKAILFAGVVVKFGVKQESVLNNRQIQTNMVFF